MNSPSAERDWRVGHEGRDQMYYEEYRDRSWCRIRIDGEMLVGPAHHVIYFASAEAWMRYPEWARHRRDQIIARIKSEFRAPDYEYHGDSSAPVVVSDVLPDARAAVLPRALAARPFTPRSQIRALFLVIGLLLGIGGGMGWMALRGVAQDHTYFPAPRATQRRIVSRTDEPKTFWFAIGIYAAASAGAMALAGWGIRAGLRQP